METQIIIGRNPVLEALKAGSPLEKIFLLYGAKGAAIEKIRALARERKIPCIETGSGKFRQFPGADEAQGVLAQRSSKKYSELEDLLDTAHERQQKPFLLILDGIEDPQNLGAMIRTAECAGAHGVVIAKHHAAGVTQAVHKASAGASEHLPIAKVTNIAAAIDRLKESGLWIVGTDAAGTKLYDDVDYNLPVAVVIGSEGSGMRRLVKEKCDFLVRIPMLGKIRSLNASVSAALVLYEVVRNRRTL